MSQTWSFIVDFAWLSFLFLFVSFIKSKVPFFKRYIIPTAMLAGFIGLFIGSDILGLVHFNTETLGLMVYHLMAIGFIALSLKQRNVHSSPALVNSGLLIVTTYLVQGILGFGILLILVSTIYPTLFPGVGMLLPLGFGQGPGQAYSLGTQWEELGLVGGGNLGLTFAGLGFVWATFIGIIIMNMLIKSGKYTLVKTGDNSTLPKIVEESAPDEIPLSDAMDKFSFQIALIGFIYLITYLTINGLTVLLTPLGVYGATLAQLLFGFHFLIGSLYAVLFRSILNKLKNRGIQFEYTANNYLLQRISGFSFDYMIAASITAISIYALKDYLLPVLLLTTAGGIATILYMLWICPRLFPNDKLPNILGFYGMLTGTISTGMALVKAVDPQFKSSSTENMVLGSGTAILFGFPLLLILNIPIVGYVQGQPIMYLYTFASLCVYFIILLGILLYRTKSTNLKQTSDISVDG